MSQSQNSYTKQLRSARAEFLRWLPDHEAVEQESRRSYQRYSEYSGQQAELAIRALGAGEDVRVVAGLLGYDVDAGMRYIDADGLARQLERGLRDWLIKSFPESIR